MSKWRGQILYFYQFFKIPAEFQNLQSCTTQRIQLCYIPKPQSHTATIEPGEPGRPSARGIVCLLQKRGGKRAPWKWPSNGSIGKREQRANDEAENLIIQFACNPRLQ